MNYPNSEFVTDQKLNGDYTLSQRGIEVAKTLTIGSKVTLTNGNKIVVKELFSDLPHLFYFKGDNKQQTYGMDSVQTVTA